MSKVHHTRRHPCPVCGGHSDLPHGHGVRCYGDTVGDICWCSREQYAGKLQPCLNGLYRHRIGGFCRCGVKHGEAVAVSLEGRGEMTDDEKLERGSKILQQLVPLKGTIGERYV